MKTEPGLFGHLVTRFSSGQAENLGTEALAYVLQHSPAAASAFEAHLRAFAAVPAGLHYQTQASADDDAIPDLVGRAATGGTPVLLEAKFWAGLTPHQPVTYLRRLPTDEASILMFVVPSIRIDVLWAELLNRVEAGGWIVSEREDAVEYRLARLGDGRRLAITSWPALLQLLIDRVTVAGDAAARSDLEQLLGLCSRMDGAGFWPLSGEELSGSLAMRLDHFSELIDRAVDQLVTSRRAARRSVDGTSLGASAGTGWWGRFFAVGDVTYLLRVTVRPWARDRATPLWLQVGYKGRPTVAEVLQALAPLRAERDRVFPRFDYVDVAVDLPLGREQDDVVAAIAAQLDRVGVLLANRGSV